MDSGVAVQAKGRAVASGAATNASMRRTSSCVVRTDARRIARRATSPTQRSTWLSQDAYVGARCAWYRGRAASHARTAARLWVA
jgi:hypothetical protein